MKHKVFLNDEEIIEQIYIGELKYEELEEILKRSYEFGFALEDKGKVVKVLMDMRKIGKVSAKEILNFASMGVKSSRAQKIAVFGARKEIQVILNMIFSLSGRKKLLRMFEAEADAKKWLTGKVS